MCTMAMATAPEKDQPFIHLKLPEVGGPKRNLTDSQRAGLQSFLLVKFKPKFSSFKL
jgi:hypothetical protein